MTLEYALLSQLKATTAITAIAADRIYAVKMPQPELNAALQPSVVFTQSGRSSELMMGGTPTLPSKQYEIICASENYDSAHELADAVAAAIEGWNENRDGLFGGVTGVDVQCIELIDQFDLTDDQFDLGFFMVQTTVSVSYRQ